jgi:4'-phosphopantetheinyl transferase
MDAAFEAGGVVNYPDAVAVPSHWPLPGSFPKLAAGQIHLWCASMQDFAHHMDRLRELLSEDELSRATKFHFSRDRDHYIIRHGIRRLLLGRYLGLRPDAIGILLGARGKPEVKSAPASLHFNDSHSEDLVIYGVSSDVSLGVDIERVRPIADFENIATNYFSPREVGVMRELQADQRMLAFYAAWTRKEAFLKATGEGIGENLAKVEVTLKVDEAARIIHLPDETHARWKLHAFFPVPGYCGALAFKGECSSVENWTVPPWIAEGIPE